MDLHGAIGHGEVAEQCRERDDETERRSPRCALLGGPDQEGQDEPRRGSLRGSRCPGPDPRHAPEVLVSWAEYETQDRCQEEAHDRHDSYSPADRGSPGETAQAQLWRIGIAAPVR